MDVDDQGLDGDDRGLIRVIIEKFSGGPVGLETLAAAVSEDAETIENVLEPYLMKEGYLKRTPRGRVATERAYQLLGRTPPPSAATLGRTEDRSVTATRASIDKAIAETQRLHYQPS